MSTSKPSTVPVAPCMTRVSAGWAASAPGQTVSQMPYQPSTTSPPTFMRQRSGLPGTVPRYIIVGPPFCSTRLPAAGQARISVGPALTDVFAPRMSGG